MKQTRNTQWSLWGIDAAGVALCLAASAIAYASVIGPLLRQNASAAALRQQVREQEKTLAELQASVRDTETCLVTERERLSDGRILLESPSRTNERIAGLAALFGDHGLEIDDVLVGNVLPTAQCAVVPMTISGRGGYREILTLFRELTRTFADTSVATFNYGGSSAGTSPSQRFTLELLWYAAPEGQGTMHGSGAEPG